CESVKSCLKYVLTFSAKKCQKIISQLLNSVSIQFMIVIVPFDTVHAAARRQAQCTAHTVG
ncbi:hypothetical protein JW960_14915, partial [candidate division KSB1 bacterium]|nr:hypothetical protein [candidate division KSB1 bacterium]